MKRTMKLIAFALVLTLSVVMLASCFGPNANPEKAVAALKENDYVAARDESGLLAITIGIDPRDVTDVVSGTAIIDKKGEHVTIIYFEDADAAKAAWEKVKKYAEDEDKKETDSDWTIKQSGKMIWFGTEAAIKATY